MKMARAHAHQLSLAVTFHLEVAFSAINGVAIRNMKSLIMKLTEGLQQILDSTKQDAVVQSVGAMFTVFSKPEKINRYRQWTECNLKTIQGIPSQFDAKKCVSPPRRHGENATFSSSHQRGHREDIP